MQPSWDRGLSHIPQLAYCETYLQLHKYVRILYATTTLAQHSISYSIEPCAILNGFQNYNQWPPNEAETQWFPKELHIMIRSSDIDSVNDKWYTLHPIGGTTVTVDLDAIRDDQTTAAVLPYVSLFTLGTTYTDVSVRSNPIWGYSRCTYEVRPTIKRSSQPPTPSQRNWLYSDINFLRQSVSTTLPTETLLLYVFDHVTGSESSQTVDCKMVTLRFHGIF